MFSQEWLALQTVSVEWLIKLGMAVVCGSLIGIERQLHRKAAGMRTNVMICLGATLYVLAAELIGRQVGIENLDPSRIAGQVVVGMGFIGAGSIMQSRGKIHGLTTAATLWVVAAIGVLIGLGFPILGFLVTVLVVMLLVGVGKFEYFVLGRCKMMTTRLSFRDQPETWERLQHIFDLHDRKLVEQSIERVAMGNAGTVCFLELTYCHVHPDHSDILLDLLKIPDVRQTNFRR